MVPQKTYNKSETTPDIAGNRALLPEVPLEQLEDSLLIVMHGLHAQVGAAQMSGREEVS